VTQPRLYLLDVEGTTSPISLVTEQLFPFARRHLKKFVLDHVDEAGVRADLALLVEERAEERDAEAPPVEPEWDVADDAEPGIAYLLWLMDRDRKSTALKSLQGKIWKAGFEAGELVGTVFEDVPEALARWSRAARVAIYSSGSVEAQQLLFRHSSAGDLTAYLSGYFDTRVGAKGAAESYRAIAAATGVATDEMLFVSDVVRELDAAREAGCATRLSIRAGNQPVPDAKGHTVIRSFAEIG
jgi:enolase-phosphatase E1